MGFQVHGAIWHDICVYFLKIKKISTKEVTAADKDEKKVRKREKDGEEAVSEPVTLEVREGNKIVRMEFKSEEDRDGWLRAYRKSRYYTFYFMVGIGVNFLLYFAGLDLSRKIFLGALVGLAVPLTTMFGLTELHMYLLDKKSKGE